MEIVHPHVIQLLSLTCQLYDGWKLPPGLSFLAWRLHLQVGRGNESFRSQGSQDGDQIFIQLQQSRQKAGDVIASR